MTNYALTLGTSSEQDPDDIEAEFVEVDPTGRYGRYKEVLGRGAFKKVYRAFDQLEGIEVAWNQIKVAELLRNSEDLERLYSEVHLLKTLKHKNIIKFYNSWVDTKNEHINFITEIFTSGTLRRYRKKHKHVDLRALKKWSRQILEGLHYLHSHDPPVIHRDLKCDNVFVNGNHGEVKIGDLGLAAILHHANAAHSVIGTPEFMAPELYEEEYNELVDIYAFGMCLLELVTLEYPYSECTNAAQIYKKVSSGIKPASLTKVTDPDVKAFIEKCIANVSERLPAIQLLSDPFLLDTDLGSSLHVNVNSSEQQSVVKINDSLPGPTKDFSVQGERKDVDTIFVKLRIPDSKGHVRNIHFPFDIEADTSIAVASEMVHELDLADQDIHTIADMIDSEIRTLIPDWSPRDSFGADSVSDSLASDSKHEVSSHTFSEIRDDMSTASSSLFPDRLASGRKFWSDSPRASGSGLSPLKYTPRSLSEAYPGTPEERAFRNSPLRRALWTSPLLEKVDEVAHEDDGDHMTSNAASILDQLSNDNAEYQEDNQATVEVDESGEHGSSGDKTEDLRTIAEKVKLLLAEQQKELDQLRRKHELVIYEALKELSPEKRLEVFHMCSGKIPEYTTQCGGSTMESFKSQLSNLPVKNGVYHSPGASVDRIFAHTSTMIDVAISPRFFQFCGNRESDRPNCRGDKLSCIEESEADANSSKKEPESDRGIAVVLKADGSENSK